MNAYQIVFLRPQVQQFGLTRFKLLTKNLHIYEDYQNGKRKQIT